jgi:4-diphosphocytidyl-2-C-methyl-D-erythritol kinase
MAETIHTYQCPAKVNLALSVGAQQPVGYHPINSWMAAVSLYDDLNIRPLESNEPSEFEIGWADDAPRPHVIDWPIEDDLTCRACQLLEHHVGRPLPVAVQLNKRIPAGAGLGGGSSDAATMLRAMNELFELGLEQDTLHWLARSSLGSDVPFFIDLDSSSAIVTGFGEMLDPVALNEPLHLALILPRLQTETRAVYERFDAQTGTAAEADEDAIRELAWTRPARGWRPRPGRTTTGCSTISPSRPASSSRSCANCGST